jgi:Ni/Fe-hydrogenase 1 B-type cytochrome subunit
MSERSEHAQVYVWDLPVRVTHWLIALSIVVLAATGFYLGRPFIVVSDPAGAHFVTGTIKVIHSYSAIVFTLSVLARLAWLFVGTPYARWDQFVPVAAPRRRDLVETLKFYLFFRRRPPECAGHNPLAGATYVLVFFLYLVMIGSGTALYSAAARVGSPMRAMRFVIPLFGGLQTARFIHHIVMWLLIGFVVHHIFSALLTSAVERNGEIDSIFSGYKTIIPRDPREKKL